MTNYSESYREASVNRLKEKTLVKAVVDQLRDRRGRYIEPDEVHPILLMNGIKQADLNDVLRKISAKLDKEGIWVWLG